MIHELWSHPEKQLLIHSREVAAIAIESIRGKEFNFDLDVNGQKLALGNYIKDLVYLSAAFHDLGKATLFFQKYIRNPAAPHDKRKSHALLSALFVFYIAEKYLETKLPENDFIRFCSVFAFSAVKRHHGKLNNLSDEILIEPEWRDLLPELASSVNVELVQPFIDELIKDYDMSVSWQVFLQFISDEAYDDVLEDFSFDILEGTLKEISSSERVFLYYFHHTLYSALLFADKNEVNLSSREKVQHINIERMIADYREKKGFNTPSEKIDRLKNESFFSSVENLDKVFKKDQHIYSVTLPTGLGKTITAYMLADRLRKLAGIERGNIIINIPFTSIIDQNFDVYAEILQTNDSSKILKHHHLADPVYKSGETNQDYSQSKFLIETWQSDTVVTTFVQLLETILSCDKAKLMKFGQMANAVVLLDEIQTIPYSLWETIRDVFKTLGERMNMYFVLISATQPLMFNPHEDIVEIVPDHKRYFRYFNRTRLVIKEAMEMSLFQDFFTDYIYENPEKDILCILNTKKAALGVFEKTREVVDTENIELYYLTTLITPFERKRIIERIRKSSDKQKIIVSTQLIEAGVDISVDTVFRQLAPFDSIIQAAGRANRYNEKPAISDVFVVDIEDYRKASNMVYGSDLMIKTQAVIKNYESVEEKDYLELIDKYFAEVRKQSDNTSQPILKAIKNLEFGKVDFELIESRRTESVYVQLNERAKDIWDRYVSICIQKDLKPWERDELFSKIKSEFYDFVINVPIHYNSDAIVFDSEKEFHFYVSKLEHPSQHYKYTKDNYRDNTGYINDQNTLQFF